MAGRQGYTVTRSADANGVNMAGLSGMLNVDKVARDAGEGTAALGRALWAVGDTLHQVQEKQDALIANKKYVEAGVAANAYIERVKNTPIIDADGNRVDFQAMHKDFYENEYAPLLASMTQRQRDLFMEKTGTVFDETLNLNVEKVLAGKEQDYNFQVLTDIADEYAKQIAFNALTHNEAEKLLNEAAADGNIPSDKVVALS